MNNRLRLAIALLAPPLAACGAVDPASHEESSEEVGLAAAPQEAAAVCQVNPKTLDAQVGQVCASDIPDGQEKTVSAIVVPRFVTRDNALYKWKVKGLN